MIGFQLAIQARLLPDTEAVAFASRRLSYGELNRRACRLANGLRALGLVPGDRVAGLMHNCNQFLELLFAAAKIGAIFAPINFRLAAREIDGLLAACMPRALVAGLAFDDVLTALQDREASPAHVLRVDDSPGSEQGGAIDAAYEAWLAGQDDSEPTTVVTTEEVLMLLHSSGTTGLPKGAIFTHATTLASSTAKIIDFHLTADDTAVVFGPLFHAGPLMDLALPLLLCGGRVVLGTSRKFDPETLLHTIAREHGTVVPIYPTMLRRVLEVPDMFGPELSSLRMVITGGEPAPVSVLRHAYERLPTVAILNNYGSTEGGPITTFLAAQDKERKVGSVGKPAFSVDIRIADGTGRALPDGEVGEVLVRSPFVCRGYWNRPEATAAALQNGWWHTGDLAWRDEEGFLWIAGRKKDMIKSGTENIYPIEVEQVIAELPGVLEVGVFGVADKDWGESVAACIVKAPDSDLKPEEVIEYCKRNLASYKKPRYVYFVASLPRTTVNKVSKARLRAWFADPDNPRPDDSGPDGPAPGARSEPLPQPGVR